MAKEIKRDFYLEQLIKREGNGLIKIVTGIKKCGKSYLLRTLFKNHLLENGIDEKHIIEMAFDLFDNIEYRDPKIFYPWAKEQIQDDEKYYFLLDEVQLLDEFVSVLNGLADKKDCDVFVTGSNAKFLSRDIATEFGGRGDEVHMYPLSFSEFMSCYDGNKYDGWNEYITYGGIPLVVLAETDEQKMTQEIRPFLKINDSFKKIVITSDTPKPFYNEQGILIMNVYEFLLNADSLEL